MTGPDFIPVGGDQIDLTEISVGGPAYVAGECADVVYVQVLESDGSENGNYAWLDLAGEFEPGWYDVNNDFAPITDGDVTISIGQGLWVQGDDGFVLQVSALILK